MDSFTNDNINIDTSKNEQNKTSIIEWLNENNYSDIKAAISDEQKEKAEKEMKNMEAIVNSMTIEERRHPEILKNSRKVRIAKGCGKTNADINRVLKKFEQTKEMMKQMKQYQKSGRVPPGMGGLGGLGGF